MKSKRKFFVIALAFMMVFSILPTQSFASDKDLTLNLCLLEDNFVAENQSLSIFSEEKYNGSITLGASSRFGEKGVTQIESVYLVTISDGEKLSIITQSKNYNEEDDEFEIDNFIGAAYNTPLNNNKSKNLPHYDGVYDEDEPLEINRANFSDYIVSVEELGAAGINFADNLNLDTNAEYYFFAIVILILR